MPRKTGFFRAARAARGTASMRPRPDAAENGETTARWNCSATRFNEAAARCRGKPLRHEVACEIRRAAVSGPAKLQ